MLAALVNHEGIFRKDFLEKADSLTRRLARIPDVRQVLSPTNLKRTDVRGLVPARFPVLRTDTDDFSRDSAAIFSDPSLVGSFFAKDGRSVTIFIKTSPSMSKVRSDTLAERITRVIDRYGFDKVHIAGRIFAQAVYLDIIREEFILFFLVAVVLVVLFLSLSFRSLYGTIVPVTVVLVSVVWTLALMELNGKPIDLMTTMLPTMIFIAGTSDVVHFFSKFFEEKARGTPGPKIMGLVFREVGVPTLITLVTTAVGFLSLLFSSIRPVREFGVYTTIGITLAFILTYTLLPALLHFIQPSRVPRIHRPGHRRNFVLQQLLVLILPSRRTIAWCTMAVVAASVVGITLIRQNHVLLEDLQEKVPVKQDFNFFDKHYSGVRPFEMDIRLKDTTRDVWDYSLMRQLHRLDSFVTREYGAGLVISPAGVVKTLTGDKVTSAFPTEDDYDGIASYLVGNRKNKEMRKLVTPDGDRTRVSAKIRDMGSSVVDAHNARLDEFISAEGLDRDFTIKLTGAAHLIDRNNDYMVENMLSGFGFSVITTGLLTFFLYRSWRMVLVFLIPNVLPAFVVAAIMGFAGIELKAATAIVFSIAFGIATDDTIHFISRLKLEMGRGKSLLYSFKRTFMETGKPIILTTFILIGGFMSLMTSSFQSTFYFGLLICITLVVALMADLFLLPVLLFLLYSGKKPGTG